MMKDFSKDCSSSTCSIDSFDDSVQSKDDADAAIANAWRKEKLEAIARRWKLTEQEQEQLMELKSHLEDVKHVKNDPEDVVRFLRDARSVKGAERMFRKFIKWRVEKVDSILKDYDPDPVLKSHFPMTLLNGFDKDGDGLWVERPGVADCYGLYERFGKEELVRYCVWVRESACHSSWCQTYEAQTNQAPRMTVIVDLKGLNRSHLRPILLPVLAEVVHDIQAYYCGFIKKIILIREPAIFKIIWKMVKVFFNANMQDLMVFAGSNYIEVLKEHIDDLEGNLPPWLVEGGTGTIAEGMPQRMDGGRLPPKGTTAAQKNKGKTAFDGNEDATTTEASTISMRNASQPFVDAHASMNIELDQMTDRESMAVRCHLLAKGTF